MNSISHKIFSSNQIKKNEVGGVCRAYGERRGAYSVSVGKYEVKRALERPRHRRYYNVKTQFWTTWTGVIGLRMVERSGGLSSAWSDTLGSAKCGEFLGWVIGF
jgi:hypothetical protein